VDEHKRQKQTKRHKNPLTISADSLCVVPSKSTYRLS
jgi:hypothetical protein